MKKVSVNDIQFPTKEEKTNKSYSLTKTNINNIEMLADSKGLSSSKVLNIILDNVFSN